jgi:hypothetical protein
MMKNRYFAAVFAIGTLAALAQGGELKKSYFEATKPGAWSEYLLASPDGSKSAFSYERRPDQDGRVVLALGVKVLAGPGEGSESKNIYTMPPNFDLANNGLSYGKFPEKMVMQFSGMDMPVDETTLAAIRKASKDYRGAVAFEAVETVNGHSCDRYAYSFSAAGIPPAREEGRLWLDASVPFGIVKQTAKVLNADGSVASSYEMHLQETGAIQMETTEPTANAADSAPAPATVALADGYKAGKVGLEVEAVAGGSGHSLRVTLVNKTEAELTVQVPAGNVDLEGSLPVEMLQIAFPKAQTVVLPAGESGDAIAVLQRGSRGILEGHCSLSVYEGTPLFSGSITKGSL